MYSEEDLLARLVAGSQKGKRPFAFLVGAPLTAPYVDLPGVPSVSTMIRRVQALLGTMDVPPPDSFNPYQSAFQALIGRSGPDAVEELVRAAVLEACTSADPAIKEMARQGQGEACRKLESDPAAWSLSPGVAALGAIVTEFPATFDCVLTTNFDPLVQVAIRHADGRTWGTRLHSEGNFESSDGDGCHVVYLHGVWYGETLHTPSQLTAPRPLLKACLQRLLDRVTLIVLAYGGWQDVFTETLIEVVRDPGARPDVLWTFYRKQESMIAAENPWLFDKLAPQLGRRVNAYAGIDCHTFLPRLLERFRGHRPALVEGRQPSKAASGAVQMQRSPFFPGQAILKDENFFGRHAQRELLQDAIARGQSAQILGEFRMGKTSLLRWVERHAAAWQPRPVAWVNGQGVAGRSPDELVREVGRSLGRITEVERKLETHALLPDSRAAEAALTLLLPCVLLVDEAAALAEPGHQFDREFLNYLRALGEDGLLVWISASRTNLRELFEETGLTSSFLNNTVPIVRVGQIEETAARELLARGGFGEATMTAILQETGGFAGGLQWLGDGLWRRAAELDVLFDRFAEAVATDFRRWWERLQPGERELLKQALGLLSARDLSEGARIRARALVDRGLLVEKDREFSVTGSAWRRFVESA